MKRLFLSLFSMLSFLAPTFAQEPALPPFYIGINAEHALPLVEVKNPLNNPEIKRGIWKDLGEALGSELKKKPMWILLPKKRVAPAILDGGIEIFCHTHEVWQPMLKNKVQWSHGFYTSTNLIVHLGKKEIHDVKDLLGHRVGTVVNFIYQNMDDYFNKDQILREDGPNNAANIQKLFHGRINYIIMSNLEYNYYKMIHPTLNAADLKMDSVRVKCALSKKSKITLEKLNQAIDAIHEKGIVNKILRSYEEGGSALLKNSNAS